MAATSFVASTFTCPECGCVMAKHVGERAERPVMCPDCQTCLHPNQPSVRYLHCPYCKGIMSHNMSDLRLECPHCHAVLELPLRLNLEQFLPRPLDRKKQNRKKRKAVVLSTSRAEPDPNRPQTARAMFITDYLSKGRTREEACKAWAAASKSEKMPYEEKASTLRAQYAKAKAKSMTAAQQPPLSHGPFSAYESRIYADSSLPPPSSLFALKTRRLSS